MAEDAHGTVIVEARHDHEASTPRHPIITKSRSALSAAELARLLAAIRRVGPQGLARTRIPLTLLRSSTVTSTTLNSNYCRMPWTTTATCSSSTVTRTAGAAAGQSGHNSSTAGGSVPGATSATPNAISPSPPSPPSRPSPRPVDHSHTVDPRICYRKTISLQATPTSWFEQIRRCGRAAWEDCDG